MNQTNNKAASSLTSLQKSNAVLIFLVSISIVTAIQGNLLEALEAQLSTHMILEHALFFFIGAASIRLSEVALRLLSRKVVGDLQTTIRARIYKAWKNILKHILVRTQGIVWLTCSVTLMAFWHMPATFDLASLNAQVHVLQHLSFIVVGATSFMAVRTLGGSFPIILLFFLIGMMGFSGLVFSVLDDKVYIAYSVPDHNKAGDYMIIVCILMLLVGLPLYLISKTVLYAKATRSE